MEYTPMIEVILYGRIQQMNSMKKYIRPFKNKYILTFTLFFIYNLFLDDVDVFSIWNQNSKLDKLRTDQSVMQYKLRETKATLKTLKYGFALEKYAREEKLFKRDNEDVFVITYE